MLPHLLGCFWCHWKLCRLLPIPSVFRWSGRCPRLWLRLPTPLLGQQEKHHLTGEFIVTGIRPGVKEERSDLDGRRLGSVRAGGHTPSQSGSTQFLLTHDSISFLLRETLKNKRADVTFISTLSVHVVVSLTSCLSL